MSDRRSVLRERKRDAVRDEVATEAMRLFVEHGYQETTVEQIAQAAGLSTRSFFRYFEGKDAVMDHAFGATGAAIVSALVERPASEPAWIALRRAYDGLIGQIVANPRSLSMLRMIYEIPALHTSHLRKQARWQDSLAAALTERMTGTEDGSADGERALRAQAIAGAAVSCFESARVHWVRIDGAVPLARLVDISMDALGALEHTVTG